MQDKLLKLFINNIDSELNRLGLDRAKFAELLKVTPQAMSNMLNGENRPRLDRVEALAHALKISPAQLLMTPEERAKFNQNRPSEGVSAQEKLSHLALSLTDVEASNLLDMAQHALVVRAISKSHNVGSEKIKKKAR